MIVVSIAMFLRLIISGYGEIVESSFVFTGNVEQRLLLWGIPAMLLSAGLIWFEQARPDLIIKNKAFLLLGDASYSIYLTHLLFIILLGGLIQRVSILRQIQGDLLILLFICIAISAGILFHLYIEKPLIKKLNTLLLKNGSRKIVTSK